MSNAMSKEKDNIFLKKETLDRILLIIYGFYMVLSMTGFLRMVQNNTRIVRYFYYGYWLCYCLAGTVALINLFCKRYSLRDVVLIGVSAVVVLLTVFFSDDKSNLFLLVFIGAYCLVDFDKLLKWSAIVHLAFLVLLVFCSLTGVTGNAVLEPEARHRACLGFDWPSYSANFLFYAILAWLAWRKTNAGFAECGALAAGAVFLFLETDTKNAFVLSLLAICAVVIMKIFPVLAKYRKLYGFGILAVTVTFPLFMIFYTIFGEQDSALFLKLNAFLSDRLNYGKQAFENYGLTLFGQKIKWIGGTVDTFKGKMPEGYNYVDSSFLQILFNYGIVFLIMVLAYLFRIEITAIRRKDTFIIAAYTLLIVHTAFEPHLLLFSYQPLILGLSYIHQGQTEHEKEKNLICR